MQPILGCHCRPGNYLKLINLSMLILYHPWREECDLIKDYSSAEASFKAKGINSVLSNNNFSKQVESAVCTIQSHNDIIVNDYIAPF